MISLYGLGDAGRVLVMGSGMLLLRPPQALGCIQYIVIGVPGRASGQPGGLQEDRGPPGGSLCAALWPLGPDPRGVLMISMSPRALTQKSKTTTGIWSCGRSLGSLCGPDSRGALQLQPIADVRSIGRARAGGEGRMYVHT